MVPNRLLFVVDPLVGCRNIHPVGFPVTRTRLVGDGTVSRVPATGNTILIGRGYMRLSAD